MNAYSLWLSIYIYSNLTHTTTQWGQYLCKQVREMGPTEVK